MSRKLEFAPSPSQLRLLKAIRVAQQMSSPRHPSVREIAAYTQVHYSLVSRNLRLMAKKGWIVITPTSGGYGRPRITFKVQI